MTDHQPIERGSRWQWTIDGKEVIVKEIWVDEDGRTQVSVQDNSADVGHSSRHPSVDLSGFLDVIDEGKLEHVATAWEDRNRNGRYKQVSD